MSQTKVQLVNDVIGNSGFGDDSPDRELVVKKASSNATVKIEASNAHTSQLFFSDTDTENIARISVFHGSGSDQNSMIFGTAGSSRLAITSAGNIGVSTISPVAQTQSDGTALTPVLDLKGTGSIANASGVLQFTRKDNASQGSCIYSSGDDGGLTFRNTDGNGMRFFYGTAVGLSMNANGNWFFHSTNSSGSNGRVYTNKATADVTTLEVNQNGGSGTEMITFRNAGTQLGTINQSGSSGVSYQSNSDYRLKENDVKISDGITRLKQLRPIRFNWKADTSTVVDGFFAHEVSPVVPEAVRGNKDEVFDTDGIGTQVKGGAKYQQLEQSKLVPLLTAALQEEIAKREALETRVATLEAA